ncbi:hypothetical protein BUALT_Bualt07G0152500 [Buddleja alternifolia]|uniref:Uncharacterized protein n=1 Tax=Buddleja alternifolia TaxID=168488 RepID=A0AAV6XBY1_9LAMI|nr:hypothetical protein BUALT_Bualt07G0152500 [Buddleja alternifolia]
MGILALVYVLAIAIFCSSNVNSQGVTLVPAIITFGDSVVDVGNNDYIPTIFKSNYPPYGRDFKNKEATGRFCNGKLATDITAETLGFTSFAPAYLSPQASGKNLLLGANFASAACNSTVTTVTIFQGVPREASKGARRIGVTSLPPLGCLPAARTIFGFHESGCVSRINTDAQQFNKKINSAATQLGKQLPGLKVVVFDVFKPLYDLVADPKKNGFTEATKGCCGTGKVETTSLLCNPKSYGTCSNATQYVFWDSVHPSQAANQILADSLIIQGIALIS